MAKHTLQIEEDYDFTLIGIASHVKDYRICWALNKVLSIYLKKQDALEIKDKKQSSPSYFSFFKFDDAENFLEYHVISNLSESKIISSSENTLFPDISSQGESLQNEYLLPEFKNFNFLMIIKGELNDNMINELISKIKTIEFVLTVISIDVNTLKSKHNLIF